MITVINKDTGMLEITPENKLESYLLNGWSTKHKSDLVSHCVSIMEKK